MSGKTSKTDTKSEPVPRVAPDAKPLATTEGAQGVPSAAPSSSAEVADFLARMKDLPPAAATGQGRLIFAMDATMSREPT